MLVLLIFYGGRSATARFIGSRAQPYFRWALFGMLVIAIAFAISSMELTRYRPSEPYYVILITGMVNSIRVGVVAALGAVILGFIFGVCQLSPNWLLRNLVHAFTETMRNVPMLLHVLFWYTLILNSFPPVGESFGLGAMIFVSNRGVYYPTIEAVDFSYLGYLGVAWVLAVFALIHFRATLGTILVVSGLAFLVFVGLSSSWEVPALRGFNFVGGSTLSPEYTALLVGLIVYYSSFIADIVRSGIRAIPIGQWEGARSLGFTRLTTIRLIIIPQAMRIIVPPLSNQMLGLAKDTSLGIAVAYPDFVAISRTVINQTGQALEVMFLVMTFYLVINLAISSALNLYNERLRIIER
jgi:general L-amino acid transport system permease protein